MLRKEQQEVRRLTELNENLKRKFRLIMDYNRESIDRTLVEGENFTECVCGGTQLNYFKREWEEKQRREVQQEHHNGASVQTPGIDS